MTAAAARACARLRPTARGVSELLPQGLPAESRVQRRANARTSHEERVVRVQPGPCVREGERAPRSCRRECALRGSHPLILQKAHLRARGSRARSSSQIVQPWVKPLCTVGATRTTGGGGLRRGSHSLSAHASLAPPRVDQV